MAPWEPDSLAARQGFAHPVVVPERGMVQRPKANVRATAGSQYFVDSTEHFRQVDNVLERVFRNDNIEFPLLQIVDRADPVINDLG